MNKKNIKPLILSSLAALSLGSMSVAGTFALFTDKAETKVEIQAGVVDVDAEISDLAFYELGVTTPITNMDSSGAYVNSIGGTAKIDGSTLVLNKWAPGDKVTFKLTVKNKSNVDILTRLRETHSTTSSVDLYEALDITYTRVSGLDADKIFHWNPVGAATTAGGDTVSVLNVTIEFPNHGDLITAREEGIDNHYQNSNCTIVLSQQAVQGNAEAVDLVSQWNQYLAASEGVNNSLTAAIAEVDGTEAQLKSERIVWKAAEDKFYYEEEVAAENRYQYFKAYDAMPTVQNWSVYATTSWNGTDIDISLKGIGFDVGGKKDSITSVSYVGEATARINRIYTNSASTNITINAPLDTVQHYGVAGILDIQAVAGSSYHEFGKVAFAQISKGRIALEENSEVAQIHVEKKTESTFDEIIIAKAPSVELPTLSRDDVNIIPSTGTLVVALQKGTGVITTETDLDYVWLTKQGVYKQIAISDNKNNSVSQGSSTTVYADQLSSSKQETQTAAQQIANNIVDQVVIDEVTYNVSVDTTSRDIVLTNDAQPSQKASAEATAAAIAAGDVVKESGLNETKKGQAAAEQVAIVTVEENDDNVARIGTHGYATLEAAVAAAGEGSTVVLLKDVSLGVDDSCIGWAKGRFSLDLNGHTMRTVSEKGVELNNNGYTSGVFYMSEFDRPVTIKNGTVISKYGTAIYVDGNTADNVATIENVVATNEQYGEGKGGSTHYASAVRVTSAGHVLIKSGVFSGYNAIDLGSGGKADVCTIEGGTFYGRLTVASDNAQLIIKGGTFDNDPTEYVDPANYNVEHNADGTYTVVPHISACYTEFYEKGSGWTTIEFDTLAEAIVASNMSEAAGKGAYEIYLYRDVNENLTISIDEYCDSYTPWIYLEGHTLSGNITLNGTTLTVVGGGTLASNVTVNSVTVSEVTHNASLHLGVEWTNTNLVSTGVITLNGKATALHVCADSIYDAEKLVNVDGLGTIEICPLHVWDDNDDSQEI